MTRVVLPKLGDMVEEVVILEWQVAVGDVVAAEDPLVMVETDKADTDVPSPVAGTVTELLVAAGDDVPVGAELCVIEPADGA